ncbi:MAG: efflux RND transporter periplasmic adaptor subunit [candidate division Zixibacteria bacterium]|nr:efflux RND transporter periplasmic adaptor subunit [candidate division Zixibacteria bacterium]
MKFWKKIAVPAAILVGGYLIMQLLLSMKSEPPKKETAPKPRIVSARVAQLGDISFDIVVYGRVQSSQPIQLYSEVSGEIMEGDIPFKDAQAFKKGDLILRIDDRQAKLRLNSAKSDLLNALAAVLPEIRVDFPGEYQKWQDYFDNCTFDSNLRPLPETANQKIKLFLSRFNVYKLYFSVRDLEINLEKHHFYAPFDGAIIHTNLELGSTARNGSLLGEIINMEELEVEAPVQASDLQWIDRSKPVFLSSTELPGEWKGRIIRVGSAIDTRTQTVPVYIKVYGQNGYLLNGTFMEAHIPGKPVPEAIYVPRSAVYNEKQVYIVENGELKIQDVSYVRRQGERLIIDSGIADGDTVVVEALQGAASGMPAEARLTSAGQ